MRCQGPLTAHHVRTLVAMQHLERLSLEHIDIFPTELCALANLRVLEIEGDLDALPEEIREMRSLGLLRLRAKRLRVLPESIADLEALVEIDLRGSSVRDLPNRVTERVRARRLFVRR